MLIKSQELLFKSHNEDPLSTKKGKPEMKR